MKRRHAIQLFVICASLQTISSAQASPKLWGADASEKYDLPTQLELAVLSGSTPPPGFQCPEGPLDIGHESQALEDVIDSATFLCSSIRSP